MTSKFFVQCIIKQLLDSVLVISRIIKVLVRVISLSLRLRLITLTETLIILDITKTSSNNCLKAATRGIPLKLKNPIPLMRRPTLWLTRHRRILYIISSKSGQRIGRQSVNCWLTVDQHVGQRANALVGSDSLPLPVYHC